MAIIHDHGGERLGEAAAAGVGSIWQAFRYGEMPAAFWRKLSRPTVSSEMDIC